jgi:hypothetical protein
MIRKGIRKIVLPLAFAGALAGCSTEGEQAAAAGNSQLDRIEQSVELVKQAHAQPDFGSLDFTDLEKGVKLDPQLGNDWEGNAFHVERDGVRVTTDGPIPSALDYADVDAQDGKVHTYEVLGVDNSGHLTGSTIEGNVTPYANNDWNLEVNVQDTRFDDNGNVNVAVKFDENINPGNRVNVITYSLLDSAHNELDSERFYSTEDAKKSLTLDAGDYRGKVNVVAKLGLEQGPRVVGLDSTVVADDMPQLITGVVDQNKTAEGYRFQVSDFSDKGEADKFVAEYNAFTTQPKLGVPAVASPDTLVVNYDTTHPNGLVGECWVTTDGRVVNYDKAFAE